MITIRAIVQTKEKEKAILIIDKSGSYLYEITECPECHEKTTGKLLNSLSSVHSDQWNQLGSSLRYFDLTLMEIEHYYHKRA